MNRAAAVSFALLLGTTVLAAQTASQGQPQVEMQKKVKTTAADGSTVWTTEPVSQADVQKALTLMAPYVNACPVSLRAQQSSSAYIREVGRSTAPPKGPAQWLHIHLASPASRRVVAATVTVHGFADKSRMVDAGSAVLSSRDSTDAARRLDVQFPAGPGNDASMLIRVPGLTGVSTIDLNSVTYADGSSWKLAARSLCRVPIDGMMLISSH